MTFESSVWSYGVALWEIFSSGSTPYPGWNNQQTRDQIDAGYRMQAPYDTPPDIGMIMESCWMDAGSERPTFAVIVNKLRSLQQGFWFATNCPANTK